MNGLGTEDVSIKADLLGPAHPPKTISEQFINTPVCDAFASNSNKEYSNCNKIYKVYTDTDSDGKTEVITDITCKFNGKLVAIEVKADPGSGSTTAFQREIFSETGTGTSCSNNMTHSDRDMPEEATDPTGSESSNEISNRTSSSRTTTPT